MSVNGPEAFKAVASTGKWASVGLLGLGPLGFVVAMLNWQFFSLAENNPGAPGPGP